MRHAFKFNIIKFSSWTSLTVGVCAWTTEITTKGFVKISHRLDPELTTGRTLFWGQNIIVSLISREVFGRLLPRWTMLRRANIFQEFQKLDTVGQLGVKDECVAMFRCRSSDLKILYSLLRSLSCSLQSSLLWMSWVLMFLRRAANCVAVSLAFSLLCFLVFLGRAA